MAKKSKKSKKKEEKEKKNTKAMNKKEDQKTKKTAKKTEKKQEKKAEKKESKLSKPSCPSCKKLFTKKSIIISVVILLVALAYRYRGMYIAAMVNGMPISRLAIVQQAEKAQGAQILEGIITEQLILQEAEQKGVKIDDQVLDQEIADIRTQIEGQGQELEALLAMQGMTLAELKDKIRVQKLVEAMLQDQVEVTQEEIDQYLEDNKEFLDEEASEEELQEDARLALEQQKLGQKYQEWLQEIQDKAEIKYFVGYGQQIAE